MSKVEPVKYDNEIVVTQVVANEHHIKIGDKVKVGIENHSKEMIIGINQCANDMGENISMGIKPMRILLKEKASTTRTIFWRTKARKMVFLRNFIKSMMEN